MAFDLEVVRGSKVRKEKMFNSDLDTKNPTNTRRLFLASAAATLGGLALWSWRKSREVEVTAAAAALAAPGEVTIVLFSDSGQRLKTVHAAKVIKTEAEWRK